MAEHTPGPWLFDAGGRELVGPDSHTVAYLERLREPIEANGRLIAAAPEMLECLKVFLAPDDLTAWDVGVWMEQARRVVAQLEGKP